MVHKYTFIVMGGTGKILKQIQFSRWKITATGFLLLVGVAAMSFGIVDYIALQQKVYEKDKLEHKLAQQTEEVIHQRQQIQLFAQEINTFKEKLVQLDQFKRSIRIIANVDKSNNGRGLFGVGGSAPEDIDPAIELTQKHKRLIKDMHQQMGQLNQVTALQQDELESLFNKLEAQRNLLAHTPAIRPAKGWISSKFGFRQSPFTNKREFHKGLDIANRKGAPIVTTANGVVSFTGTKGLFGEMVVIDHGHGIITKYAHLDKIVAKVGEQVKRGHIIGHMGNTGRSTGPHLHYEVHLNGVPMNPAKYILN